MITTIRIIIVLILSMFLTSCTDVIDVEVQEAEPRLVIEGSLDWEKGTSGNEQTIKLSISTPYFDSQQTNVATGALVTVTDDVNGTEFVFIDQNNGNYTISNFVPQLNHSYTLEVIHDGDTYIAQEKMTPVVDIARVYQSLDEGDDEALEINVDFNDPADEENYYFLRIKEQADVLPTFFDIKDEFVNGNLINLFYERVEDEDINQDEYSAGDIVDIRFYGISKQYFNYIGLLIQQYESVGDPFSTIPVALRGNCVNTSNPENYAYGYFRLTQVVKTNYTFQ